MSTKRFCPWDLGHEAQCLRIFKDRDGLQLDGRLRERAKLMLKSLCIQFVQPAQLRSV